MAALGHASSCHFASRHCSRPGYSGCPTYDETLVGAAGFGTSALNATTGMPGRHGASRSAASKALGSTRHTAIPSAFWAIGDLHGVDHLGDDVVLRARPLVARAESRTGVLHSIDRGDEERIERDVANEDEFERPAGQARIGAALRKGAAHAARETRSTRADSRHQRDGATPPTMPAAAPTTPS